MHLEHAPSCTQSSPVAGTTHSAVTEPDPGRRGVRRRHRFHALALVAALGAGWLSTRPVSAALGDRPMITWNMQGAFSNGQSLWPLQISRFVNVAPRSAP